MLTFKLMVDTFFPGSSQCIVGENVMHKWRINHINADALKLSNFDHGGIHNRISLSAHGEQFYITSTLLTHKMFLSQLLTPTVPRAFVHVSSVSSTYHGSIQEQSWIRYAKMGKVIPTVTKSWLCCSKTKFGMMGLKHILHVCLTLLWPVMHPTPNKSAIVSLILFMRGLNDPVFTYFFIRDYLQLVSYECLFVVLFACNIRQSYVGWSILWIETNPDWSFLGF